MDTKKTAPAEQSAAPEKDRLQKITGVTLKRLPMEPNVKSTPAAFYMGAVAPTEGEVLEFTLENGVTYRGTVAAAVVADGEVMAEFNGALNVVKNA